MTSDTLRLIGQIAVRQIRRRIRENKISPKTSKAGTTLVQRGKLLRSIRNSARGEAVVITAGDANIPYAKIHHEGGIIRPKNAKFLAIPITTKAKLYKPREYPGETFISKGVIFLKEGSTITPLYALKKQVLIPARPYMFLDDNDISILRSALAAHIKKQLTEK